MKERMGIIYGFPTIPTPVASQPLLDILDVVRLCNVVHPKEQLHYEIL